MQLKYTVATFHLGVLMHAGLVRQQRRGRSLTCLTDVRPLISAHAWLSSQLAPLSPQKTAVKR